MARKESMTPPSDISELAVTLRRIDGGNLSRVLDVPREKLSEAMSLRPTALSGTLVRLAEQTLKLPRLSYSATQLAQRRRLSSGRHLTAYRNYSQALRQRQVMLGGAEAGAWPSAERLDGLLDLMGLYTGITRYTATGISRAMDLRLLLGALQFYMLSEVTRVVVAHLEDPALPKMERSRIEAAFASILEHKEQLLATAEQRRATRKRMNEEIAAQIAASQERSELLDTLHAIAMGVPVDQASLEKAAMAYVAEKRRQGQKATTKPAEAEARAVPRGGKRSG
jgi:hypothetical protein